VLKHLMDSIDLARVGNWYILRPMNEFILFHLADKV